MSDTNLYCLHCGQDMTKLVGDTCIACQMPVTPRTQGDKRHDAELEEVDFLVHLKEGIESRNDELFMERWATMRPIEAIESLIETKRHGRQREH